MKYFIWHPDATGRFDPPGYDVIRMTEGRVEKLEEADVVFVIVTRFDGFRFDEKLNGLKKPWVLFDWCEFGWDDDRGESYLWNVSRMQHPAFQKDAEWQKFTEFVHDNLPIAVFQRELFQKDCRDNVFALDYLNWLPEAGNDTKEDFLKRPIEVEFDFGRSHEGRMWLHGAIFQGVTHFGYEVVSEFSHLEHVLRHGAKRIWLSVHTPWYARLDVQQLQGLVRRSIITVVMPGAGQKTFRASERASDSIMAMPENSLAQAYPWDSSNSIILPRIDCVEDADDAVKCLADAIMRTDLYELYCNAMENGRNYRPAEYCRRHIAANVEKAL